MPSLQQGTVDRLQRSWRARWRDAHGKRHAKAGFRTKSDAYEFLRARLDEVALVRRGGHVAAADEKPRTVDQLLDLFLERHGATIDPLTKRVRESALRQARSAFGERRPDSLHRLDLEDWKATLSPGNRHNVFRAFRQALRWGAARGLCVDASAEIKNPKPKRSERKPITPFESWDEIVAISDELDARYRAIPIFATGTGLRPEEWIGLWRSDIDRAKRVVHVQRRHVAGQLKDGGKTDGSVRTVPLRQHVLDALSAHPLRLDTPILFPAPRGGYLDLEKFRYREWTPALAAAGLDHRGPYTMRHTFATWAIEADIPLSHLAVVMGTSVRELEDTYARWLKRTNDQLRSAFDAYDQAAHAAFQQTRR